ncbi:aminotransferase class V-fold PLP-dependent enzyme [Mollicutes bacterium LVI A0039]|nr:aminotransferase class V-fold PLP-dependent enzyme [Mollicutes bacterium LVI A0039]
MYLDNAATTKIHPDVMATMQEVSYANYNAKYYEEALLVQKQVDQAINAIAKMFNISDQALVFTSGATESNNYIIKGMFELFPDKHFVTSTIEHKCVLATFKYIETKGARVTYVKPNNQGQITKHAVASMCNQDTVFISIMHVNNETGVINDIAEIQAYAKQNEIYFHSDAVQSLGKTPLNFADYDFLSFSGHKVHGPKGIGLAVNNTSLEIPSLIHGSDQQHGHRAGTLPNELIVGLAKAVELILKQGNELLIKNKEFVINMFADSFGEDLVVNFHDVPTVDSIISMRLVGEVNQIFLEENKEMIKASTGSSCSINNPSYVLQECGFTKQMIQETIRISVNKYDDLSELVSN